MCNPLAVTFSSTVKLRDAQYIDDKQHTVDLKPIKD